jgi:hypothetical protein
MLFHLEYQIQVIAYQPGIRGTKEAGNKIRKEYSSISGSRTPLPRVDSHGSKNAPSVHMMANAVESPPETSRNLGVSVRERMGAKTLTVRKNLTRSPVNARENPGVLCTSLSSCSLYGMLLFS